VFAADLPRKAADINAVSQRPADLSALGAPSGAPAWKTIPSWYLVATQDYAIGVDAERFMAARAKATPRKRGPRTPSSPHSPTTSPTSLSTPPARSADPGRQEGAERCPGRRRAPRTFPVTSGQPSTGHHAPS
jgi:hypothetical protein